MMKAKGRRVCILLCTALGLMGCATRQDLKEVDIRLLALEQGRADQVATQEEVRGRMAAMDVRVEAQEQDLRTSYARMRSEMDTLRLALQEMQGRMEESKRR